MRKNSLECIIEALNAAEARYMIVGGLAAVAYGHVRLTADVDMVISLESENVRRTIRALEELGYRPRVPVKAEDLADPAIRQEWIAGKGMVVFSVISERHAETVIDILVEPPFDFEVEYKSAKWFNLHDGLWAPFIRLEQLIAMKQRSGRAVDLLDVQQLKKIQDVNREQ